ncbi:MAG: SDR family oxidoreductase [Pseudomonadota bacterium]
MRLEGKIAIVTGGSQGIGEAIATRYAAEGAKVAIFNRTVSKAERVVDGIVDAGGQAAAFACDIGNPEAIQQACGKTISHFGIPDILVNNAGAYLLTPLGETNTDAIDQMLNVNIRGPFLLMQALMPHFEKKGGGKVINIGSIFGNTGFPGSSIYCATKAAVNLLTKTLGLELRGKNIQVNSIAPGWIETPLNEDYRKTDKEFMQRASDRFGGGNPWMKPDELSGAAVFLASSDADSMTGTTTFVDRGWSAY